MNDLPLWAQIVISFIASGTIGGLAGSILTAHYVYKQKQEENRRTIIGNHINTIYFPLYEILKRLEEALDLFNQQIYFQDYDESEIEDKFRKACLKSIEQTSTLLDQGKDAYLTKKLEEHLQSFKKFVQDSVELEIDTALVLIHTPLSTQKLIIHTYSGLDRNKMMNIIKRAEKKK